MSDQDNRLARKLLTLIDRSGPQVSQNGNRLVIQQGNQTITVQLGQTVQQSGSTPRFR
jgi:hypothetical protein